MLVDPNTQETDKGVEGLYKDAIFTEQQQTFEGHEKMTQHLGVRVVVT